MFHRRNSEEKLKEISSVALLSPACFPVFPKIYSHIPLRDDWYLAEFPVCPCLPLDGLPSHVWTARKMGEFKAGVKNWVQNNIPNVAVFLFRYLVPI